eukprot:1152842-Pelagomonas_calceolata.AAC.4
MACMRACWRARQVVGACEHLRVGGQGSESRGRMSAEEITQRLKVTKVHKGCNSPVLIHEEHFKAASLSFDFHKQCTKGQGALRPVSGNQGSCALGHAGLAQVCARDHHLLCMEPSPPMRGVVT